MIEVIILGSGTFQPELRRHCSSYLLRINKQNLIFDFGRGILDQIMKLGISCFDIEKIFISHMHADHCSELISFIAFILDEPKKEKFRSKYVTIYGPKGIKKTIGFILKAFYLQNHKYLCKIKIKELSNNSIVKGQEWVLKSFEVKHNKNMKCLAYRLRSGNKIVCYSGDTSDYSNLKKVCKNSNLAIIEATLPLHLKPEGHMCGTEVGRLAKETKIKRLVITHIAPIYLPEVKKEIQENYRKPIIIAKDLMKIRV